LLDGIVDAQLNCELLLRPRSVFYQSHERAEEALSYSMKHLE
jgi:hypothetical protein